MVAKTRMLSCCHSTKRLRRETAPWLPDICPGDRYYWSTNQEQDKKQHNRRHGLKKSQAIYTKNGFMQQVHLEIRHVHIRYVSIVFRQCFLVRWYLSFSMSFLLSRLFCLLNDTYWTQFSSKKRVHQNSTAANVWQSVKWLDNSYHLK